MVNRTNVYQCENSSKWISKHRLGDENFDCCLRDDEDDQLSCSFDHIDRIKCVQNEKCLSSLHRIDDCPSYSNEIHYERIPFSFICNGFIQISFKDSNGILSTDETNCDQWPCNNLYTRCDQLWRCANGEDEHNCYSNGCEQGFHRCLSIVNHSFILFII